MSTNTLKQALEIVYGDIKNINKRVKNLESASIGVLYNETTKSAVAYQDNVSANACPYALLNILGGMSYKVLDNDTNEYVIRDSAVSSVISKDSNDTTLQTINIPSAIQQLEGYGWGINDTCYNYIDLNTKKFIQKVARVDLGDFTWAKDNYNNWLTPNNSIQANSVKALCSNYPVVPNPENVDYGCKVSSVLNKIIVHDKDTLSMTSSQFKEYVSGVYFYYELATPIETDISSLLPADFNSIQIEANGTITFDNTYQQAIPYEYLYLEKVGANNE